MKRVRAWRCELDLLTKTPERTQATGGSIPKKTNPQKHQQKHRYLAGGNGTRRKRGSCNRFFVAGTLTAVKVVRRKIDTCEKINCERRRMWQRRTTESPSSCRVRVLYATRGCRSSARSRRRASKEISRSSDFRRFSRNVCNVSDRRGLR
jgi:hypothetical protein